MFFSHASIHNYRQAHSYQNNRSFFFFLGEPSFSPLTVNEARGNLTGLLEDDHKTVNIFFPHKLYKSNLLHYSCSYVILCKFLSQCSLSDTPPGGPELGSFWQLVQCNPPHRDALKGLGESSWVKWSLPLNPPWATYISSEEVVLLVLDSACLRVGCLSSIIV